MIFIIIFLFIPISKILDRFSFSLGKKSQTFLSLSLSENYEIRK